MPVLRKAHPTILYENARIGLVGSTLVLEVHIILSRLALATRHSYL